MDTIFWCKYGAALDHNLNTKKSQLEPHVNSFYSEVVLDFRFGHVTSNDLILDQNRTGASF